MRAILSLALCALLAGGPAVAGSLGVYADRDATQCNITVETAGVHTFYIVYTGGPGIVTIAFSAPKPDGLHAEVLVNELYDAAYFRSPGTTQTGIELGHYFCEPSPMYVMAVQYWTTGPADPCTRFAVGAHPDYESGKIEAWTCGGERIYVEPVVNVINGNGRCPCPVSNLLPVNESTWGGIKALYETP